MKRMPYRKRVSRLGSPHRQTSQWMAAVLSVVVSSSTVANAGDSATYNNLSFEGKHHEPVSGIGLQPSWQLKQKAMNQVVASCSPEAKEKDPSKCADAQEDLAKANAAVTAEQNAPFNKPIKMTLTPPQSGNSSGGSEGSADYSGGGNSGGAADDSAAGSTASTSQPMNGASGYTRYESKPGANSDDKCAYSATYNGSWSCGSTDGIATTANVANQLTQMGGAAMIQMQGQQNAANAANAGTQSATYEAASKTAKQTADVQMGAGLVNVGFGAILMLKGMQHSQNAKKAKALGQADVSVNHQTGLASGGSPATPSAVGGQTGSGGAQTSAATVRKSKGGLARDVDDVISAFGMNKLGEDGVGQFNAAAYAQGTPQPGQTLNQASVLSRKSHVKGMLGDVTQEMAREQSAAGKMATTAGMSSFVTGAGQLIMSAATRNMANSLQQNANALKNFETQNPVLTAPTIVTGNGAMPTSSVPGFAPSIVGTDPTPNPESTSPVRTDERLSDNEKPIPMGLPNKGFEGLPTPAPQVANSSGSADSGSPGGLYGSGIGGGAGGGEHGDNGAGGSLPNERDARYSSSGGGAYGAGGRGGAGESGSDLSGMLEKMMAAANKEDQFKNKPGLEEFGRDPASELPYSFLDKSVDIFQRVHQAYQAKAKSGRVALFQ